MLPEVATISQERHFVISINVDDWNVTPNIRRLMGTVTLLAAFITNWQWGKNFLVDWHWVQNHQLDPLTTSCDLSREPHLPQIILSPSCKQLQQLQYSSKIWVNARPSSEIPRICCSSVVVTLPDVQTRGKCLIEPPVTYAEQRY